MRLRPLLFKFEENNNNPLYIQVGHIKKMTSLRSRELVFLIFTLLLTSGIESFSLPGHIKKMTPLRSRGLVFLIFNLLLPGFYSFSSLL